MDEKPKLDLKKHTLPPVSRRYLIRIIIYVIFLLFMGYLIFKVYNTEPQNNTDIQEINLIDKIEIDSIN